MSHLRTIRGSEQFERETSLQLAHLNSTAACFMSAAVTYRKPDSAGLMQDFLFQDYDQYAPALPVIRQISQFRAAMKQAKSVIDVEKLVDKWERFRDVAEEALDNARTTVLRPLSIDFGMASKEKVLAAVETLPFPRTAHFLNHWATNLDGPMRHVVLQPRRVVMADGPSVTVAKVYSIN